MKRLLILSLIATFIFSVIFCLPVNADGNIKTDTSIVYLDNGDYIETSITYFETILSNSFLGPIMLMNFIFEINFEIKFHF